MDPYHFRIQAAANALSSEQISDWARIESKSPSTEDDLIQATIPKPLRCRGGFVLAGALKLATWIGQHRLVSS